MAASDKITVAVRVRPLGERGVNDVVVHDSATSSLVIGVDRYFIFDHIFSTESDQNTIYGTLVAPLITDCLRGINATVLAYGQTGSGKTFTMGTVYDVEDFSMTDHVGIIPRAIVDLFDQISAMDDGDVVVEAQFIELYNEELRDLLTPRKNVVKIQEKPGGGIYLSGAAMIRINSVDDALPLIKAGGESRSTGSTKMNAQSSRSHAILTLHISQKKKFGDNAHVELISSKFHFVDLAGSERLGRTGAEGERAKEGIKINYGLLALGNVINALSENQRHVPYRDSKLTRLLCDSLGGNSRTVLIACISPAEIDMAESINTLQYATRAKKIRNIISINVSNMTSADAETLKKLQAENRRLRQQLKALSSQPGVRARSAPYTRSPGNRPISSLPLKARQNLIQIASSFDKLMDIRMRQMSDITRVGTSRYHRMLELTNVRLQHAILVGCGVSHDQQLLTNVTALENEIDSAGTQVVALAEALRKSAASVHDLLGKVERAIQAFPPNWKHVPQTIRSAMATRLSNYDSTGLQCYNSNLIHILQMSQAEHERSMATVLQVNQIAGPSLLRRYLPSLLNNATCSNYIPSAALEEGNVIHQDGPSISSLLPGLLDGTVKRRPGTTRPVTTSYSTTVDAHRGVPSRKLLQTTRAMTAPSVAPTAASHYPRITAFQGRTGPPPAKLSVPRVSYVAAVGCDHVSDQCLTSLEPPVAQMTAGISSVLPMNPMDTSVKTSVFCRDVDDVSTVKVSEDFPQSQQSHSSPISSSKHHQVPLSARIFWHNGLPLPVVDSPEQENRPPMDVPMTEMPKSPRLNAIPDSTSVTEVLMPLSSRSKRGLPSVDGGPSSQEDEQQQRSAVSLAIQNGANGDVPSGASDCSSRGANSPAADGDGGAENGDNQKRTRFVMRPSIMERFQSCGIDVRTFAPPPRE